MEEARDANALTEDTTFDEARKAEKIDEFIQNLCTKLRCSALVNDLEKLDVARGFLQKLQYKKIFERALGPDELLENDIQNNEPDLTEGEDNQYISEMVEEEECKNVISDVVDLPENQWHGYFKGFSILNEHDELSISENKKCIEINPHSCSEMLETFLRAGVRCFCIDLFLGTEVENQHLIVRLRECELTVSKECNFPITSTLFAKLSPRLQYTGELDVDLVAQGKQSEFVLTKDGEVILTVERAYSMRCFRKRIYVNACFLLVDVQECDFICIGNDIQLQVKRVTETSLRCRTVIGGVLENRMPVLFPARCNKFRVSLEELENITFAHEVGINIIVSYIVGTKAYFDDLKQILTYFKADNMRLCARFILNDLKCCNDEFRWASEGYDGFIVELSPPTSKSTSHQTEILHICPAAYAFLQHSFDLKKPIILDPVLIVNNQYNIDPEHYFHFFYYPDKYIFKCGDLGKSFYFFLLQNALFSKMAPMMLSKLPFCDQSFAGGDSLARSAVAAAFEMDVKCILIRGISGRTATKVAHYRPKVPIIFVTDLKSAIDYVGIFHNLILLNYPHVHKRSFTRSTYKQLLFGAFYAKSRKLISHDDNVIMMYNSEEGTRVQDKYIAFKFDEEHFPAHLQKIICGVDN